MDPELLDKEFQVLEERLDRVGIRCQLMGIQLTLLEIAVNNQRLSLSIKLTEIEINRKRRSIFSTKYSIDKLVAQRDAMESLLENGEIILARKAPELLAA